MTKRPTLALLYARSDSSRWARTVVTMAVGDQAGPCRSHWRHAVAAGAVTSPRRPRLR
jgi:hypothetical protein